MHAFGENVDRVVAPTTREAGTKKAMEMTVLNREAAARREENKKTSSTATASQSDRQKAIAELEREKE